MDPIQREKSRIQKREQRARAAFSLLLLTAFLVPTILLFFLARSPVLFIQTIFSTCSLPLFFGLLLFLIVGLGLSQLGPYMQKTRQQKQRWLNEYGQHIHAVISKHPAENALLIGGRGPFKRRFLHPLSALAGPTNSATLRILCAHPLFFCSSQSLRRNLVSGSVRSC